MSVLRNCGPLPHFHARDAARALRVAWTCDGCGATVRALTEDEEAQVRDRLAHLDAARDETQRAAK
jgi:hypothetical protein